MHVSPPRVDGIIWSVLPVITIFIGKLSKWERKKQKGRVDESDTGERLYTTVVLQAFDLSTQRFKFLG